MNKQPTKEELLPEILKAIAQYGTGTFTDPENKMSLHISKDAGTYLVIFCYDWLTYRFNIKETQLQEGVAA